jgi:hypothetical protein
VHEITVNRQEVIGSAPEPGQLRGRKIVRTRDDRLGAPGARNLSAGIVGPVPGLDAPLEEAAERPVAVPGCGLLGSYGREEPAHIIDCDLGYRPLLAIDGS